MQLNREKLEDIVGLYRDPPEHALVLCDRASRKSGGASKGIRRADGSWRLLIRGLTASANSWYVTRRLTGPTLRSTCSPPPSSAFEKCRRASSTSIAPKNAVGECGLHPTTFTQLANENG